MQERSYTGKNDETFSKKENEWLYQFCAEKLKMKHYDYFIFGHRHLPMEISIDKSQYINLGEWMNFQSFASFDGLHIGLSVWNNESVDDFKGIKL